MTTHTPNAERLERTLIQIARKYASPLIPPGWVQPGDYTLLTGATLSDLAGGLASYNVLALLGDLAAEYHAQAAVLIKDWVEGYTGLYTCLTRALFPSFTQVNAFYGDSDWPPLIGIYGAATPVIMALAEFIAPFVAARYGMPVSNVELWGLMDTVLEEIEATDLPREELRRLRDDAALLVRTILASPVRQLPLTPAAQPIFGDAPAPLPAYSLHTSPAPVMADTPIEEPTVPLPPAPPEMLPEAPAADAPPPDLPEMEPPVPVFFRAPSDSEPPSRRPPVPDLPEFPV